MSTKINFYIVVFATMMVALALGLLVGLTSEDLLQFIIRFGALLGFFCLFMATLLSALIKKLYKAFGKPFIKIHHVYSIMGLVLVTLHPIGFAISKMDLAVFIPVIYPWFEFWRLAGRPALILIYISVVAGALRKKAKNYWRYIHALNYIALIFAYIHGVIIGTDFQNPVVFTIYTAMTIISIGALLFKRYVALKMKKKKKSGKI
ncbi:MAG: hypothetical protein JW891_07840 [Candidatus Lokiarchaeota archaeon]|nr:hypothetical protein [Candidatus Lokiarchaeota archaeon]